MTGEPMAATLHNQPPLNDSAVHLSDEENKLVAGWLQETSSAQEAVEHRPSLNSHRNFSPSTVPKQINDVQECWGNSNLKKRQKQEMDGDILGTQPCGSKDDLFDGRGRGNGLGPSIQCSQNNGNSNIYEGQEISVMEAPRSQHTDKERALKLSPTKICELASSHMYLPTPTSLQNLSDASDQEFDDTSGTRGRRKTSKVPVRKVPKVNSGGSERAEAMFQSTSVVTTSPTTTETDPLVSRINRPEHATPSPSSRTVSTPLLRRRLSSSRANGSSRPHQPSSTKQSKTTLLFPSSKAATILAAREDPQPSPMPQSLPVPPLSLPTYLQLEMSSQRPSPLYIHRSVHSDFPYESSAVKLDRLLNFLFLPPQLEQILWFGALACLDAWLYSFTILPLRFLKALSILGGSWGINLGKEAQFIGTFIYTGTGRMWQRKARRESTIGSAAEASMDAPSPASAATDGMPVKVPGEKDDEDSVCDRPGMIPKFQDKPTRKQTRTESMPSPLSPDHKADILKGFLIIISCTILMYFDASRIYHGIRGQAAIKLYVIYNVLEVCDRLFSALGQDVLECLFSKETLERKPNGRSKVWTPFWMFILALCYNLVHSTALFYQVITLNVAVNSYSNALLTLLMSNQFVEIKSTVFKKFEKENLFQLTCADVVERFQLWLMLMIIAARNIIETGGLTLSSSSGSAGGEPASASSLPGSTLLPKSFTVFPKWTGQVMGPFFLVLGSEMLVDWIKHAYITKFNNTKPAIYGRFLDVMAKDYYSNAFADQNLTRRLGLPVIPLACLFIRASVQTYHMFLTTHMPLPLPSSATSLSVESATASPATTAALQHIDHVFRGALGRSAFGTGEFASSGIIWGTDDIIAFLTMLVFFLVLFLTLLAFKLVLGMGLLSFARHRYRGMKQRERSSVHAEGRRLGGWGVVEVDEDKRRWIYVDDPEGAKQLRERELETKEKEARLEKEGGRTFERVSRYEMINKRIW